MLHYSDIAENLLARGAKINKTIYLTLPFNRPIWLISHGVVTGDWGHIFLGDNSGNAYISLIHRPIGLKLHDNVPGVCSVAK